MMPVLIPQMTKYYNFRLCLDTHLAQNMWPKELALTRFVLFLQAPAF